MYGAIAFYLANRTDVDAYLAKARDDYKVKRLAARDADPMFYQKLAAARRQTVGREFAGTHAALKDRSAARPTAASAA